MYAKRRAKTYEVFITAALSAIMIPAISAAFCAPRTRAHAGPAPQSDQVAQSNQAPRTQPPVPTGSETPLVATDQLTNRCAPILKSSFSASASWTGWSPDPAGSRFQPASRVGLTAENVPHLKLKWAFGIPNVKLARTQPAIYRGRVYVGAADGTVYSLDAATGCVFWATTGKPVRSSGLAIGKSGSSDAVFYGDPHGNAVALDAVSGKLLWATQVEKHPAAIITGTPTYYDGRLYVPVSSSEELAAARPGYQCCTFRGSVVALDAASGEIVWKTYTVADAPTPREKSKNGTQTFGPSGVAVWSAPTIDVAKRRIYIGTGDNYSEPDTDMSDSLVALDLASGKILWSKQFTSGDAYNVACASGPGSNPSTGRSTANCPDSAGPDYDFGSSPILETLPPGKRVVVMGQKAGLVYGVDPDAQGKLLWRQRAGVGGLLGGVQWGPASDGKNVYVAVSDLAFIGGAYDPAKGGGIIAYSLGSGKQLWKTPPPGCGDRAQCSPAQSAAVTAIPGVVFSGSIDAHLRAYDTRNGKIIWDFDAFRPFDATDGIAAKGGSFDVGGPVVAGGMLYVVSGAAGFGGMSGNVLLAFTPE
jgi:polyvinyl alcohol dehydrogenase (cytochrome)